jgi:type IV protein arginine methyltransferase
LTDSSTLLLRTTDEAASGSLDAFLKSKLRYKVVRDQHICVLDVGGEEIGVMMGWEENIMRETVQKLCLDHPQASGFKVLNIGFGLGIVGPFFLIKEKIHVVMIAINRLTAFFNLYLLTVLLNMS